MKGDEARHIVGDVSDADLCSGPCQAYGPDEQATLVLDYGEHMLDPSANDQFLGIGAGYVGWHWFALGFLLVDARSQRPILEPRLIGL